MTTYFPQLLPKRGVCFLYNLLQFASQDHPDLLHHPFLCCGDWIKGIQISQGFATNLTLSRRSRAVSRKLITFPVLQPAPMPDCPSSSLGEGSQTHGAVKMGEWGMRPAAIRSLDSFSRAEHTKASHSSASEVFTEPFSRSVSWHYGKQAGLADLNR